MEKAEGRRQKAEGRRQKGEELEEEELEEEELEEVGELDEWGENRRMPERSPLAEGTVHLRLINSYQNHGVIPAKAGISLTGALIPAFAGMTPWMGQMGRDSPK